MKLACLIGTTHRDWQDLKGFAIEAERIGIDSLWSAEFLGHDAFTPLAFVAGQTSRVRLGSGVATLGARSPASLAMAAMSLASMSTGRFVLGIGAGSRPYVSGWHGASFPSPSVNLRETIEVVRLATSGVEVRHAGHLHALPGDGNPAFACEAGANGAPFPIYIAALSKRSLELTGELADGWVGGISFMPELASFWLDHIALGAARSGRTLQDLDLMAPTVVAFGEVEPALAAWKPFFAQLLGSVGAWAGNHHHGAYRRAGYGELLDRLRDLWLAGRQDEAIALVPDEFVLHSRLVGDDRMVRERVRAYREAGVSTLQLYSFAPRLTAELESLARLKAIVDELNAERAT